MTVQNIKRAETDEGFEVSQQDREKYYNEHPEYTKEEYHLAIATIPEDKLSSADEYLQTSEASWEDLNWVERKDIGEKFACVFSMEKGQTSQAIKTDEHTHQVVKLIDKHDKRLKTLTERELEIEHTLQQERRDKRVQEIDKELLDKATITYLEN
jgi:parvulin-like peptidyl-prolyl isomerase